MKTIAVCLILATASVDISEAEVDLGQIALGERDNID